MGPFKPGLTPLAARPPTPPKESSSKLANSNDSSVNSSLINRPLLDTPDESPSSSAEYLKSSSDRSQKKVGFSPWTEFHKASLPGSKDSDSEGSVRRLPPSKECKSLKSILKACKDNTTRGFEDEPLAFDPTSLVAMLRTACQTLNKAPRRTRTEIYTNLLACLGVQDAVPESTDLSGQVNELAKYLRRDVSVTDGLDGCLDIQLTTQVLKVITVLISIPNTASSLPEDFCSFMFDLSLLTIEDQASSKTIVTHYMHLLEKQNFPSKLLTSERANRLITALDSVTDRVKGNRIICHRLMIYQRLLVQAKSVMAVRVASWIDHLISGMLSSIKDVRIRAIGFGMEAGLQLGTHNLVSQACIEFFNRSSPEGKRVIDFLSTRLGEMVGSKEERSHVPQIWSTVTLFFRSRRRQLECWEHVKIWLGVIQKCLNSSDPQTKLEANIAWSRLIFVINLDSSTSSSMAKLLRQPLVPQLERKSRDKVSRSAKQIARSTYYTLLYYAFRPGATHAQLDQFWDLYIAQILPTSFMKSQSDSNQACDILTALLSSSGKPRVWDQNRANMSGSVKLNELPCIDSKWIRSRVSSIIQIFEKLVVSADWHSGHDQEPSLLLAWRSFMSALGAASNMEVKVSMETMNAVTQILNFLKRFLESRKPQVQEHDNQPPESGQDNTDSHFDQVKCLIQEAVSKIGGIPFLERRVILTSHDDFQAAETPSSRSIKDNDSLNSPATHILNLLLVHAPQKPITNAYYDAVQTVIHVYLQFSTTKRTQLAALRNLARLLSSDSNFSRQASTASWSLLADAAGICMTTARSSEIHSGTPYHLGHEYKDAEKILEFGIQLHSDDIAPHWVKLYERVVSGLRNDVGDDGIALILTEPLADVVYNHSSTCDESLLVIASKLLDGHRWPQSQLAMERAHKLLWGVSYTSLKGKLDVSSHSLSQMAGTLLGNAHDFIHIVSDPSMCTFLSSISSSITSCAPDQIESVLIQMQSGLTSLVGHADERMSLLDQSLYKDVTIEVEKLWTKVMTAVEKLLEHDSGLLVNLKELFLTGCMSQHKKILMSFVIMWNQSFGCLEALEYPEDLREALITLRFSIDIQLPGLLDIETEEEATSPMHFDDSAEDETMLQRPELTRLPVTLNRRAPKAKSSSPTPRTRTDTPVKARRKDGPSTKARLRHDDSQIQFAAVESSPLANELADSQYLTDRQKEVKERQGLEAAMFPEIGPSPKSAPPRTEYSLPKLVFGADKGPAATSSAVEQLSPAYPPDLLMTDFLGSSPTSAYSKKNAIKVPIENDLPSSPPMLPPHHGMTSPQKIEKQASSPVAAQRRPSSDLGDKDTFSTSAHPNSHEVDETTDIALPNRKSCEDILPPVVQTKPVNDHLMSDADVFVDAPSEPVEDVSSNKSATDIVKNQFASENDQVTAQLVGEMERASSQQSIHSHQRVQPSSKAGMKRKSSFHDTSAPKKAKRNAADTSSQHVSQTPKAQEYVAECVLINVRPAEKRTAASPVIIKKERSESPSFIAETPYESARREGTRPKRRAGKTRATQLSQEDSSMSSSPHHERRRSKSNISPATSTHSSARKSQRLRGTSKDNTQPPKPPLLKDAIAEPGSVTKSGRRRAGKRWFWSTENAPDAETGNLTNTVDDPDSVGEGPLAVRHSHPSSRQNSEDTQQLPGRADPAIGERQDIENGESTTRQAEVTKRPEAADSVPGDQQTAGGIIHGFRRMVDNIRRIALGREEEREMSGVLFEALKEIHEAGRRNVTT